MKRLQIIILGLLLAVLLFAGLESAFAQYPLVTSVSPSYQTVTTSPWRARWDQTISSGDLPYTIYITFGDGAYINLPNQYYSSYTWYHEFWGSGGTKYQTFRTTDNYGEVVYKYTSVKVNK